MKKQKKHDGFLNSYFKFVADPEGNSHKEVLQELEDEGIDTKQIQLKLNQIVKKGLEKRRLAWQEKAQKKRNYLEALISKRKAGSIANFQERVKNLLANHGNIQFAEAYFRKKEDLSENDLINLIDDIDNLNLLDEFFDEEED